MINKVSFQFITNSMPAHSTNDLVLGVKNLGSEDLANLKFRMGFSENLSSDTGSFLVPRLAKEGTQNISIRLHSDKAGQANVRIWQINARTAITDHVYRLEDVFIPLNITDEVNIRSEDISIQVNEQELIKGKHTERQVKIYNNSRFTLHNVICKVASEQITLYSKPIVIGIIEAGQERRLNMELLPETVGLIDFSMQIFGVVENTQFEKKYGFTLFSRELDKYPKISDEIKQRIILFIGADASLRLRIDKENRSIRHELQMGSDQNAFRFETIVAAERADITRELLRLNPEIVHFSGHSDENGIYVHAGVDEQIIPKDVLDILFEQFKGKIKCVILNSCLSEKPARIIAKHIKYVIGTRANIFDDEANNFALGFYQSLANNTDYRTAFQMGRVQMGELDITRHGNLSILFLFEDGEQVL